MASIRQTKNKSLQVIIRRQGVPAQYKTFKTKTQAMHWAHEIEYAINRGHLGTNSVLLHIVSHLLKMKIERAIKKLSLSPFSTKFP